MLVALLQGAPHLEASNVDERWLTMSTSPRAAVAAFEVDGPDSKDAVEIETLRALLGGDRGRRGSGRQMVQRLLVADSGHDHMWKRKLLEWVMYAPHKPGTC